MTDIFGIENIPILIGFVILAIYLAWGIIDNVIWWRSNKKHENRK